MHDRGQHNDPYLYRFTQPDSIIPNLYAPQSFNRYSYVGNNPMRFIDPSGHMCSDPDDLWSPGCDGADKVGDRMIIREQVGGSSPVIPPMPPELSSELIASFSAWQPPVMDQTYSSCGGCSWEPAIPNPIELINFLLWLSLNITSEFDEPDVFVYLNYYIDEYENITIPSLTIDNQSPIDLSVMSVVFSITSWDQQQVYAYDISQEVMIGPPGYLFGVRTGGGEMSITEIDLIPSGDLLYPNNTFPPNTWMEVSIRIATSVTGQYIPINPYSFYTSSLGGD